MAEFNDASFSGDVSGLEGTFSGVLTADAVNAAANINIAGQAVALTTVSYLADRRGFADGSGWAKVHSCKFYVPLEDLNGGWFTGGVQYRLVDMKGDNDQYLMQYRLRLNGKVLFTSSGWYRFGIFCKRIQEFYHEVAGKIDTPGMYELSMDYQFAEAPTNVYPIFSDIIFRVDYVRK